MDQHTLSLVIAFSNEKLKEFYNDRSIKELGLLPFEDEFLVLPLYRTACILVTKFEASYSINVVNQKPSSGEYHMCYIGMFKKEKKMKSVVNSARKLFLTMDI